MLYCASTLSTLLSLGLPSGISLYKQCFPVRPCLSQDALKPFYGLLLLLPSVRAREDTQAATICDNHTTIDVRTGSGAQP